MASVWTAAEPAKIGDAVKRKEDVRLLTGCGQFSDDMNAQGQLHAVIVRSPHPHAVIRGIDAALALGMPGVISILTGQDAQADGLKPIPHGPMPSGPLDVHLRPKSGKFFTSAHHILPTDRVRYVGDPVLVVIGETIIQARRAAEAVVVDYSLLPFSIRASQAREPSAAVIHPEASSNIALDAECGDQRAVDAQFAIAAHKVRLKTWIQRVTGVPMEPRAALVTFSPEDGRYTLQAGSGNVVRQKRELAAVLGVPEAKVRVIARDVGGNFGTRNAFYPEFAIIAWAAGRLHRPVKWTCDRSEAFLSDYGGRDLEVEAELALDKDGNFLALRSVNWSNVGAQSVSYGPLNKGVELATSVYRIPVAHVEAQAIFTNTPSTNSYRSSGRPEAMFVMERLIDLAAREHGFDRVALRRRNLILEAAHPFTNAMGLTYDSGAYERVMDIALELGNWCGFEARRVDAAKRGRLRGIAVANYIEIASGVPRERAEVTILPDGVIEVVIGTLSSGQGHETSFAQLITDAFGVRLDEVRLVTGDTDRVSAGGGSHAGRSMRLAGVVIGKASFDVIGRARKIAAHVLGVDGAALTLNNGRFSVQGANESVGVFELADLANRSDILPEALRGPLAATCDEVSKAAGFPFGSHVCEVEIDPETGCLEIVNYVAVDDVGRAVNPLILHGQAHGAITQGLGQALSEICAYDSVSGQLLAGSFMDYAMPRAHALPHYETFISETPATTNALGIRAGGEGGTTPALAVLVNAAVDALRDHGVTHIEMPLTPARIWRAIQQGAMGER
jgi:carbon-monoxide dehydrogenase large subunit